MINHYSVISEKKPDILCFGYDQRSFNDEKLDEYLKNHHLSPEIIILPPFEPEKWKSSKIILE
jgi:glycerol-3-phosphate cytidylyltransferase-like family protein